jgi:hypothetical protein
MGSAAKPRTATWVASTTDGARSGCENDAGRSFAVAVQRVQSASDLILPRRQERDSPKTTDKVALVAEAQHMSDSRAGMPNPKELARAANAHMTLIGAFKRAVGVPLHAQCVELVQACIFGEGIKASNHPRSGRE